jgi:lipopolysaccharide/colanic/teichoic acid biosynthesis glycosyltransferase
MLKRLFDVVVSFVTLLLLAPLFALVAILIKLDSPGPVFFRGQRVGRFGKPFRIYKFRTMVANAEKLGGPSTSADDPRITRVGRWLRRFNLDELPQFINVIKGEMSIVGPRPEVPEVVALYPDEEREAVLSVRPGITDWATIWIGNEGERLRGSPDPHRKYLEEIWPEKRRLQLEYVRRQSLWTDFKIMALTLKVHLIDRLRRSATDGKA